MIFWWDPALIMTLLENLCFAVLDTFMLYLANFWPKDDHDIIIAQVDVLFLQAGIKEWI